MDLTTPALLFPAISLLFLAYTNRFLAIAQLVRQLHQKWQEGKASPRIQAQIFSLRKRLRLIRRMQIFGVLAFALCTLAMFCLFFRKTFCGEIVFATSLIALLTSLLISLYEISISNQALEIELSDMESENPSSF